MKLQRFAIVVLALPFVGGCSESKLRDTYDRVTGHEPQSQASAQVDLNTASARQIERLPGLSADDATRIVANRPYGKKRDLLNRGIIGEGKYQQIANYVYVSHGGTGKGSTAD